MAESVTDNKDWVDRTAKMLDRLSRSAVARLDAPGYPQSTLKINEYAALLRQARAGGEVQSPLRWFRLHFERHLEEAVSLVENHPVIQEAIGKSRDGYLGIAILNTSFGSYDRRDAIERIVEGTVQRMLVSDALTAARGLDRMLGLGQAEALPGYECTIVHGLKLANRLEIEDGISAIPYEEAKDEGFTGILSRSGAFDPQLASVLVRDFTWGSFFQSDSNEPMYTPVFRCDVDVVKLVDLFAVSVRRPLSILYQYRCVPQWIQDFGYPTPNDYWMYDFAAPTFFEDETVPQNELDNFKSLWLCYKGYRGSRLPMERAVEHISRALARHGRLALQDRILDTAIALETVYTADSRNEITYRLATRAAFFLGVDLSERTTISEEMKRFYKVRSNLAHGNPKDHDKLASTWNDGLDIAQKTIVKLLRRGAAPNWENLVMSAGGP